MPPEHHLKAQASTWETFLSVPDGSGAKERRDEKFSAPCKHTTGCTDFHNSSYKGLENFMFNDAMTMGACSERLRVSMFD